MLLYEFDFWIFDSDGVLISSMDTWVDSVLTVNAQYNLTFDEKQIRVMMSDFKRAAQFGVPDAQVHDYAEKIRQLAAPGVQAAPLYDQVPELLQELTKNGMELAIFSSGKYVRKALEDKGIIHFFPSIVSGADVANKKPHPEGIEKALELMGIRRNGSAIGIADMKKRTVMIGDAQADLEAANRAGVRSILVHDPAHHYRFHDIKDLRAQNPTYTVKNLVELRQLLSSPNAANNGRAPQKMRNV